MPNHLLSSHTSSRSGTRLLSLIGWLVLVFAVAATGAAATIDAAAFYASLAKPDWAPPAWLFGPVWSLLYGLMGIAAWLVWRSPRPRAMAFGLFMAQLAANGLWSWLFFGWRLGGLASAEVLLLLALIAATIRAFWPHNRLAAVLLLPYLAWVSFASALTWSIWQANPGLLR